MSMPVIPQEVVDTATMGRVIVRGFTFDQQAQYVKDLEALGDEAPAHEFLFLLVSRVATLEDGTPLTREYLGALPVTAKRDLQKIMAAAQRVNGLDEGEVEKA